ncbi:DNA gyrase subunit A [candidate division Kazan bacterium]|uniref:DNA gyrase subunit A n=1 Tax=candidate division Kazan bacterium TaxID=2202143 RepID=A0A420ZCS3_UNCK3|nr:MAG: DNA gyrase subunit A [candidate division Kazan bacterium]
MDKQDENKDEIESNIGKIRDIQIETEMQDSYLSYAMSVIVSRALPDVRDGLKPVHRRILYSMMESGLRHTAKYRKSAEVSGTVIAFYHPHGDVAVYDAMVRLAQPWNMRYPLVDGQGNYGSIDGDPAAANRYTEARMTSIAEEILSDIDKETVDFIDNYSNTKQEPTVLPTRVPQLLLNGTVGIAVGMATNIPPHNLNELMDAIIYLIKNPDATVDDLMEYVKGPDFPTGGVIFNIKDIKAAYETGKGGIVMRGVAEIVEHKGGHRIIVSELPYQVNKAALIESVANLVKAKKMIGISDLRDESDRDGIRVVIELRKDAYPQKVLNQLFKMTQMQTTFHVNLLALVDKGLQPKVLNLKQALQQFIDHRRDVVTRRTQYELNKAKERAHVLEGFKIALDNIDAVIKTIKKSETKEDAHANLKKKFKLSDIQASAILEMRLQALAGLERKKVEDEYKEKQKLIKELKILLGDPKKIDEVIVKESEEMKEKYGDERKTRVSKGGVGDFTDMDLIPNEEVVVTMTVGGYVKRQPIDDYRTQRRGGKGVIGMTTKEEDQINSIRVVNNHDDILFFTDRGRVFKRKVFEVPKAGRIAKGTAVVNLIQIAPDELVTAMIGVAEFKEDEDFIMITKNGVIKKTKMAAYRNIRNNGLIAIKLDEKDALKWVRTSAKGDEVMIVTRNGQSIRFNESDARPLGRSTRGVRGIRLKKDDEVVGADVAKRGVPMNLLVISERGLGKQTMVSQYNVQKRGGSGVKTMNVTNKTGKIIGARLVQRKLNTDIIITSTSGQIIRLPLKGISILGRATQGVRVMRLKGNDKVASFTVLVMEGEDGSVEDPNAEVTEDKAKAVAAKVEPSLPAREKKRVSLPAASKKKAKEFTKRKLKSKISGRSISRLASKSKTAKGKQPKLVRTAQKAGRAKVGFIKRKLTKKAVPKAVSRTKTKVKTKSRPRQQPRGRAGGGFTRRKLK